MPVWKPEIQILGIYNVNVEPGIVSELKSLDLQRRELESASGLVGHQPDLAEVRDPTLYEQMMSAVLIELAMSDTDSRYSANDFGQPDSEQAAYMLKYLSDGGDSEISDDEFAPAPNGAIRLAFFLHCFDRTKPLRTSYGEVGVSPPMEMPERLRRLFHYEPPT